MEVVIPFARIRAVNPNLSSNQVADNSDQYYKCIVVSFMSFRKFNPTTTLVLATNIYPPNNYKDWLERLEVEIRIIPFNFEPPVEFGENFKGCFYIFDVLQNSNADALYVDPDVFCIQEIDSIRSHSNHKIGVFALDFPDNYSINGLTRIQSSAIWKEFISNNTTRAHEYKHLGGEAIYIPKERLHSVNTKIIDFWDWNKEQARNGKLFLTTEEHIFTNLLTEFEIVLLNRYLSRIWTSRSFTEHQGNDNPINELLIWHLPSEKNRGFRKFYELLNSGVSISDMQKIEFRKLARKTFHIDLPIYRAFYLLKKMKNFVLKNLLN